MARLSTGSHNPSVLHVLRFDDWGGTEVQVATLLTSSRELDVHQAAVVLAPPGPVHRALADAGVEAYSLVGSLGHLGAVLRLMRLLRRRRFDLVVAYGFRVGMISRFAALLGGRPVLVIGVRGMHFAGSEDLDGRMTRFVIAVERALQRTVRCYDANSYGAVKFLVGRGMPAEKFRVIPNGVRTVGVPLTEHGARAVPRVICVARFVAGKRHDLLVRALSRLRGDGVAFECELVGHGPWLDQTIELVADLGLTDVVSFAGRRPIEDVRRRLADADVSALCSVWEGLPGSVLEAMAAGLPVVGTDVNGIAELVVDGETGILVPYDDLAELTSALGRLLAACPERERMGTAGAERARNHFSVDTMVAAKLALYRELVGSG